MYAIKNGLGYRWAWLGTCFAIFGGLASFGIGNMVQVNSMAASLTVSFAIPAWLSGVCVMVLVGLVILGGIQRIGAVAKTLVPFMCLAYVIAAMVVLVVNYQAIPDALLLIFDSAFNGHAAVGGFTGAAMIAAIRFGVARGVFSNEAGLGSAGIAQAAGTSEDPVTSGLIGMMGTFIDTLIVCSMTGLAIICSGVWSNGLSGAALSSAAFESAMPGAGNYILTTALVVFAFTTILGWSYYGESLLGVFVWRAGDFAVPPYLGVNYSAWRCQSTRYRLAARRYPQWPNGAAQPDFTAGAQPSRD